MSELTIGTLLPTPGAVAYSTTNHGVVGLSRSLRADAAVYGVGVSVLCPGALEIPILDIAPLDDMADEPAFWLPDIRTTRFSTRRSESSTAGYR